MTRWSQVSVQVMTVATAISPSRTTTFCSPAPTARIAAWGGLTIEVKWLTPYMPRLETEKLPPWYSSGFSLPSRARPASSFISLAICARPLLSASKIIGVIRPPS